jgi:thiosulfate/3-mercaptopyruvate sulfurtransferase
MLAGPKRFGEAMARCGIGDHTVVVAYSDGFGSGPHRLWWASRVYGHDTVRVLDGGFEKWVREDRPISTEQPAPRPPAPAWRARPPDQRLIATVEDVERAGEGDDVVLLDARRPEQFRGEAVWYETGAIQAGPDGIARTPRGDIRAGRIPWAVSLPWSDLYRDDRTMKSPAELRQALARAGVREPRKAITYCGVGISASALLFALTLAGVEHAALYDGSWEEWGRDPARPLARG